MIDNDIELEDYLERNTEIREPVDMLADGCMKVFIVVIVGIVILSILSLCSCSPRVIENTIVRHDTLYRERVRTDSISVHDSVFIHEYQKGDTVYRDRDHWHTLWKERIVRDTAYVSRTDTITKNIEAVKEQPISGWKWFQIWCGRLALLAIMLTVIILVVRWWLKNKIPQ